MAEHAEAFAPPIAVVRYQPRYEDFVVGAWLRSLERNAPYALLDPHHRSRCYRDLILALLRTDDTLIACDPADADTAYGFLVGRHDERVLHWVLVKPSFKRWGVATQLMRAMFADLAKPIDCTFWTPAMQQLRGHWSVSYNSRPLRTR